MNTWDNGYGKDWKKILKSIHGFPPCWKMNKASHVKMSSRKRPILNMSTITNLKQLLARVIEHSKALTLAAKIDSNSSWFPANELILALCSIGIEPPCKPQFSLPRTTNLISGEGDDEPLNDDTRQDNSDQESMDLDDMWGQSEETLKSAFQILKKWQRPAPKQYFFSISNKETKLGTLLPLPCKVCSSSWHWDKKCLY